MKRKLLVAVPLLCVVALVAFLLRPKHESISDAYISERSVTLWSSIAQVREQVGVLLYGDHVDVLARRNENVKVRTANGLIGWVDGRYLMEPDLWQRSAKLLKQASSIPVQARGRTKVPTNLRVEPGRNEPRLYQFSRNAPVEIVGRSTADWVQVADEKESGEPAETKKEDWFLVRGIATRPPGEGVVRNSAITNTTQPGDQTIPIAGWVVARFVSLDLPDPVREGAESANIRALAWFELNKVSDDEGEHPQYLAAGARGPEGMPCDFTTLRVYTWNARKTRYETAFIDNNLCGRFPIRVAKDPKGQPEFFFLPIGEKESRHYRLIQTV
ncbi:MAG TPA: SH3 domain-containing protein, partial [Gemmataceae bacterium]